MVKKHLRKKMEKVKRINKNKLYQLIGQAIVYISLYIATVTFIVWGFLRGITY